MYFIQALSLWLFTIQGVLISSIVTQKPSAEPGSEPRSEPESFAEPENATTRRTQVIPEPVPHWPTAFEIWSWAWPLHVYMFAVLYLVVAIASCFSLVTELLVRMLKFNKLKVSFFAQLVLFSMTRAIMLLVDPYISKGLHSGIPAFIVWSLGSPLVLSAFSLLLFALVDTTRMHLAPPRFQNFLTLSLIAVINIAIVLVVDTIVITTNGKSGILVFLCQLYTALYGVIYSVGFFYVGHKISKNSVNVPYNKNLKRLQCLVYTSAVIGMSLVVGEIYSATQVYGVLQNTSEIPPWPWLGLQTCARIIEISMCLVILVAFKRTKPSVQDVSDLST